MEEKIRILVVDDERVVREGCRRVLSGKGYEVMLAEEGKSALEVLSKETVDIMLLDLKMPIMGGEEVLQHSREHFPGVPVIIITGHGTVDNAVECMKKGAYDFVTKPFQVDQFLLTIERAADKRMLEQKSRLYEEEKQRNLYDLNLEKSRLKTIINCMANGVLVTNRNLEVVLHNPALTLNDNFMSLVTDVRDYIETRCGMDRMLQFAAAIGGVIENTHARLDRARRSLGRSLEGIRDREITPELIDETERAVTFWREQVPEILEDIPLDLPEEETIELLIDTKRNFDVYLSTSPDSEAGFNECRKTHWPKVARESMNNGNDLLENTLSEWHRALGGVITRIETLRMEYLPDEPSLTVPEPLPGGNQPVLQVSLAVPVTKRPGIMGKFFAQKEVEAWRKQTIQTFNQKVNKALEDFQSGMSLWLKSARIDVKNMIKGLRHEAKQNGDLAEERLKEYRALISDSGRAERQKKLADIKKKGAQVDKLAAQLEKFEDEWQNLRKTIIARDKGA